MKAPGSAKCVPICDDAGRGVGRLRPVTSDFRAALPDCAELFAKWRNENSTLSAVPFTATPEGTARWLDNKVIGREDRLLFLILSDPRPSDRGPSDGEKIGHIGFSSFDFADRSCEVDAVLRGNKTACPGMMTFALRALIKWGKTTLKPSVIRLRVFEENRHAIEFYRRIGFFTVGKSPAGPDRTYLVMQYRADDAENNADTNGGI